jgi:outer membrane protein
MLRRLLPLALLVSLPALAQEPPVSPAAAAPVVTPSPAPAAPSAPALTLEECVARALEKNFNLQLQQFSTQIARDQVFIADATFDPTLFSTAAVAGAENDNATPSTSTRQQSASLGVTQRFATGAEATLRTSLDRNRSSASLTPLFNPVYTSDVSLSVTQPLLQGSGITINRASIERARLGITRANLEFKAVVLNLIRDVESAYYTLAFSRERLAVRKFSLEVAQTLLNENKARLNTGVATNLDVLQAEVGVANARRDLLLAEQDVSEGEDSLLNLIGRFEFSSQLGTVSLSDAPVSPVSFDTSYALALANAPDYAANKVLAEQLKLDVAVAKNNRLPVLDLGAGVGFNGEGRRSAGSAVNSSTSGQAYDWQVDLTLSIPWGLRAERARYRQALTNLDRQQLAIEQIDQSLLRQVRSAVRAVETNRETVAVSSLATELSQKQFETEKARYEAGLSTYRFVEDSRQDLDTARVNELLAKVNLRIALAELARLEGTSLARYQVKLEE